jgi:hypothetical protein
LQKQITIKQYNLKWVSSSWIILLVYFMYMDSTLPPFCQTLLALFTVHFRLVKHLWGSVSRHSFLCSSHFFRLSFNYVQKGNINFRNSWLVFYKHCTSETWGKKQWKTITRTFNLTNILVGWNNLMLKIYFWKRDEFWALIHQWLYCDGSNYTVNVKWQKHTNDNQFSQYWWGVYLSLLE